MRFGLLLIAFLSFGITQAQLSIIGTEVPVNGEFPILDENLRTYQVFRIEDLSIAPIVQQGSSFPLELILGNRRYDLSLYKDNLRLEFEKPNKPVTLGGSLNNGGIVSLTINDKFIFGFIKSGSSKYYIEPVRHLQRGADEDLYVFYNVDNVIENGEHVCGATEVEKRSTRLPEGILKMPTTSCKIIDYAIANTFNMVSAFGSSTQVMNFNLGVLNDVQTNYRSEFDANLEYVVVAHYVPANNAGNPYDNPLTNSTNASFLLGEFRDWAQGPGNAGGGNSGGATGGFGVDYTMAGCWTDTDISGGVVGIAYLPGWHHLLENFTASAPSLQVMVSHEIGHNWDAVHDGSGTDFIMAPSVTLTDNWSALSQTDINARVSNQTYLLNCDTEGPPVANFFQSSVAVCTGSSIEFEDQSQFGATRSWDFINGTPATSTSEKPIITYNTNGLHMAEITSTNAAGSDSYMGYVDIQAAPPTPCTPSGTGGTAGITFFTVSNISNASGTSGVYEDFSCSEIGEVDTSTDYVIVFTASGITRVRYFIDWNNDGDFNDANESSPQYNLGNPNATYNLPAFTSPATITGGELLRFRIIGSTSSITASGCSVPTTGQVEDYAFYLEETQVFGCTDPAANNYDPAATVDDGSCTYGLQTWYEDADGDGFGNPNVSQQSVNQPAGYVNNNTDCDDADANEFPGQTWYKDFDGDQYGDGTTLIQCQRPNNYFVDSELIETDTDCDDNDSAINPGASEVCDGVDNNCDGNIDEGVTEAFYLDADNDGFGNPNIVVEACSAPPGYVGNNGDCDDSDPLEFPGQTWFKDADGDLYGDGTSVIQCLRPQDYYTSIELIDTDADCDDNNALINPGAIEICDGVDNDCDGNIDEGLTTRFYADMDGDSYGDPNNSVFACSPPVNFVLDNTDCDDTDADEFPGQTWYKDADGDLYGDGTTIVQCLRPVNYYTSAELIDTGSDCDDTDSAVNPGVAEICGDDIDNNCNGEVDEGCGPPPPCDGTNLVINNISQDEYYAELTINSDAVANLGTAVLFAAGNTIDLEAGFEVETGTPFEAVITPCSTSFDTPGNPDASRAIALDDIQSIRSQLMDSLGEDAVYQLTIMNRWGESQYETRDKLEKLTVENVHPDTVVLDPGQYIIMIKIGDKTRQFVYTVE